jgi:RNA polymerase sigma factor (sigma-70 family)
MRPCSAWPIHPSPVTHDRGGGLSARSDEQLVALLRDGDEGAFETLAARYQSRLLWYCRQILRSREDAEDALQDVMAAAFRAILADQRDIQVRPWLYRIARNRCINQLRRARTVALDSLDEQHAEVGRTPVESLVGRQQFRELIDDVQALPDTQRTALLLREIDGLAYQRIATAMDTTVPAVKSLLVRARSGLRSSATARDTEFTGRRRSVGPAATRPRARRAARANSYKAARAAATVGV